MNGSCCFPSLAASIYFPALLGFKDAHGLDVSLLLTPRTSANKSPRESKRA